MSSHLAATRCYKVGDRIADEYEVRDVLGAGGFGIVYLAYHSTTKSTYAIKTLRDDVLGKEKVRAQFRKEASIWVALDSHPNVVRAHRVFDFEDRLFVALEYIPPNDDGLNSLAGFLAMSPLSLRQALVWAIQFCQGMEHAYSKGIKCHRDIKPANIMIGPGRALKISDFGLAGALAGLGISPTKFEVISQRVSLVTVEGSAGTPTHMAPEQFVDASLCDERSDIYSFGVVLFQMCAKGELPFLPNPPKSDSPAEMYRFWAELRTMHSQLPIPRTKSPLDPLVSRCLAKDPKQRYQHFEDLERELQEILQREFGERYLSLKGSDLEAWELINKGASLFALGELAESLLYYDKALSIVPGYPEAWNNKGISLRSLGQHENALRCFDQALVSNSRLAAAWSNKGNCLTIMKRHHEAARCLDRALALEPDSACTWLNRGNLSLNIGCFEDAHSCYQKCITLNPLLAGGWFRLGLCYQTMQRLEEALRCLDRAIEIRPTEMMSWTAKATCLSLLNRNEDALACIRSAIAIGPSNDSLWFTKAGVEDVLYRIEDAVDSLKKFLLLAPQSERDQLSYATRRLQTMESLKAARQSVAEAARKSPRKAAHVAALDRLADEYARDGRVQQAEKIRQEAMNIVEVALGPDSAYLAPLLNNQGLLYYGQGRLTEAQTLHERAVRLIESQYGAEDINLGAFLTNLGVIYDDRGMHSAAQRCFLRALKIKRKHQGPKHLSVAATLEHLATSLERLGRSREAMEFQTEAQQIRASEVNARD